MATQQRHRHGQVDDGVLELSMSVGEGGCLAMSASETEAEFGASDCSAGGRCFVLDLDHLVGFAAARRRHLDDVLLRLPSSARAIGEVIEILPCFTLASTSPTIRYLAFSSVSSSTSVTVAPNIT